MAGIRVAPGCISTVREALRRKGFPSQRALAIELGLARATITNFFNGKPIAYVNFAEICEKLGLDWQAIAYREENPPPEDADIDALVQKVRHQCYDKIQKLYGKMQLMHISQLIDVEKLYVEVNILEQIISQQWLEIPDLQQDCNPSADNFDRMTWCRVRQERFSGLEAVKNYPQLMVLGKPGSGKTTFLQYLAIQCNQGNFQANKIPILIRLKDFASLARENDNFKFLNYLFGKFQNCGISNQEVEAILNHGRGLFLLDGLNEVPIEDEYEVVEQIQRFSEDYHQNQFVITCRVAAYKYRLPSFTEVEIADFNAEQIQSFAEKWFVAVAKNNQKQGLAKAQRFIQKLTHPKNQQIRELAITPILLHLTCLVFQAKADFPSNRAKLYEQGLDILLKKWDESKGIQRDEAYHNLTLPHLKKLLSHVAAITFEQGDYFFEQSKIQHFIGKYLCTLAEAKIDPAQLQIDSEAVLKVIEAQHGLLVERAREIYSFSHLTFQEYFTAREIVSSCEPQALQNLVSNIAEKRWREVFLLAAGMMPSTDYLLLLQLMKKHIDELLATDEKLQQFLSWIHQKSLSVQVPYKPVAVRAFYFSFVCVLDLAFNINTVPTFVPALKSSLDPSLKHILDLTLIPTFIPTLKRTFDIAHDLALFPSFIPTLDPTLKRALDLVPKLILIPTLEPELRQAIQPLHEQLPNVDAHEREIKEWWEANGKLWIQKFRIVMVKYCNIGHDWQFTEQQKELLKQYYYANKLLIDCLNSSFYGTSALKEKVEETLLLPLVEINKNYLSDSIRGLAEREGF